MLQQPEARSAGCVLLATTVRDSWGLEAVLDVLKILSRMLGAMLALARRGTKAS